MRVFLITLAVSVILTVVLWNFRLADIIWPAHPFLATTLIAGLCGIVVQLLLSEERFASKGSVRK